jgi:hypothetical protein
VAKTYSASEIAAEAGAHEDRIAWLVSLGLLKPDARGSFTFGAVFSVKLVSALLDAGLPETSVERAADEGWLNFDHIDDYLPHEPGPRSGRTFAEFLAAAGPRASLLPAAYEVLGLPKPDPSGRSTSTRRRCSSASWKDGGWPATTTPSCEPLG